MAQPALWIPTIFGLQDVIMVVLSFFGTALEKQMTHYGPGSAYSVMLQQVEQSSYDLAFSYIIPAKILKTALVKRSPCQLSIDGNDEDASVRTCFPS